MDNRPLILTPKLRFLRAEGMLIRQNQLTRPPSQPGFHIRPRTIDNNDRIYWQASQQGDSFETFFLLGTRQRGIFKTALTFGASSSQPQMVISHTACFSPKFPSEV